MTAGGTRATAWNGAERRALEYAIAVSLALHVLALGYLPAPRAMTRALPTLPPLQARLMPAQPAVAPKPPPPPSLETKPAPQQVRRPAAPLRPRLNPRLKPRPPDKPVANKPAPTRKPVAQPAQVRAPLAAPQSQAPPAVVRSAPRAVPAAPAPPPAAVRVEPAILAAQYRAALIAEAGRYKRYPRFARDNGWQGKVDLRLAIGPDGAIASLQVARGTGYPVLDQQALEMVRRAQPRTPIPEGLRGRSFSVDVPVIFSLRDPDS